MDYKGTSHFTSCYELKALTHTTLPVFYAHHVLLTEANVCNISRKV